MQIILEPRYFRYCNLKMQMSLKYAIDEINQYNLIHSE